MRLADLYVKSTSEIVGMAVSQRDYSMFKLLVQYMVITLGRDTHVPKVIRLYPINTSDVNGRMFEYTKGDIEEIAKWLIYSKYVVKIREGEYKFTDKASRVFCDLASLNYRLLNLQLVYSKPSKIFN